VIVYKDNSIRSGKSDFTDEKPGDKNVPFKKKKSAVHKMVF
jgi:hypothetical protein